MIKHVALWHENFANRHIAETNCDLCDEVQEGNVDSPKLTHGNGNKPWHAYEENDEYVNQLLGTYPSDSVVNEMSVSSYSPTYPDQDMATSTFSLRQNFTLFDKVGTNAYFWQNYIRKEKYG